MSEFPYLNLSGGKNEGVKPAAIVMVLVAIAIPIIYVMLFSLALKPKPKDVFPTVEYRTKTPNAQPIFGYLSPTPYALAVVPTATVTGSSIPIKITAVDLALTATFQGADRLPATVSLSGTLPYITPIYITRAIPATIVKRPTVRPIRVTELVPYESTVIVKVTVPVPVPVERTVVIQVVLPTPPPIVVTATRTPTFTAAPTTTATQTMTATATLTPTLTETWTPTMTETMIPTSTDTLIPTIEPTFIPSDVPTLEIGTPTLEIEPTLE